MAQAFRLIFPEDDGDCRRGLSPAMTLPLFYRQVFRPLWVEANGLDPQTLNDYETAINYWQTLTNDPALADLHPHREDGTEDYVWHLFDKLEDLRPILKAED